MGSKVNLSMPFGLYSVHGSVHAALTNNFGVSKLPEVPKSHVLAQINFEKQLENVWIIFT